VGKKYTAEKILHKF